MTLSNEYCVHTLLAQVLHKPYGDCFRLHSRAFGCFYKKFGLVILTLVFCFSSPFWDQCLFLLSCVANIRIPRRYGALQFCVDQTQLFTAERHWDLEFLFTCFPTHRSYDHGLYELLVWRVFNFKGTSRENVSIIETERRTAPGSGYTLYLRCGGPWTIHNFTTQALLRIVPCFVAA